MPLTEARPPEDLLFHYTTLDGLLGIFDTWTLWATDVRYLNDFREFANEADLLTRGEHRALELIANDPEEIAPDSAHKTRRHIQGMIYMMKQKSNEARGATYVTCFCEDGDLLSQWRGYGKAGVSLGFSRDALATLPPLPNPTLSRRQIEEGAVWMGGPDMGDSFRPRLVKVLYEDPSPEHIDEFAQSLVEAARLLAAEATNGLQAKVEADAMALVAQFKDAAFKAEAEHRLVVNGSWASFALDRFRVGPLGLVPYVEIPVDLRTCLRWIVIGPPKAACGEREEAVLRLLKRHQLDGSRRIYVSNSVVPFR
jgi:hypothetical protein